MFFTDITNKELQYFHNLKVPNFSITLSDLLTSELFKIEEIIEDNIYRIYPLFYTSKITSTNPNDKIIDTRCIICQKNTNETYLTFISDTEKDILDYTDYGNYYKVGDTLTENQFNSIIALLRKNTIFTDILRVKQGIVNGEYGNYTFNIDSTTIIDTGILITDETLSNIGTVTLTDQVFRWANYNLKLKVFYIEDVNAIDDVHSDNVIVTELNLPLQRDTPVVIPFETFGYNYVVSFDATVEITHTAPEIHRITGLEVYSDPAIIQKNKNVEIYGQLLDTDMREYNIDGAEGHTIYFFEKLEPTLIMSSTVNPIQIDDDTDIKCEVKDEEGSKVQNTKVHFFEAYDASIALRLDDTLIQKDDTTDFYACIKDANDGSRIVESGKTIYFYVKEEE